MTSLTVTALQTDLFTLSCADCASVIRFVPLKEFYEMQDDGTKARPLPSLQWLIT